MASFLLIHGASHGAWCWAKLTPLLEAMGHKVTALDLPGHGADATARNTVAMDDYVQAVEAAMTPDCVMVGHSFGGFPMTLAAANRPKIASALVYLCALVPQPGRAFTDFRAEAISPDVSKCQTVDRENGVSTPIPETSAAIFYSECSDEDRAFALPRLTPQPIRVMTESLEFIPPEAPRHYIRCLRDLVVLPAYQKTVSQGWKSTFSLETGHSPFFSETGQLAEILNKVAAYPKK